ncbi:hypothetical protein DVQ89_04040 [Yersinia enterocolitica]|nr:hypothetical protein [Yersinia enterocolitica]
MPTKKPAFKCWLFYPSYFKLHVCWLPSLTRIIDWRQLIGIYSVAAFLQLELYRVYIPYFLSYHGIIGTALIAFFGEPSTTLSE